uniref:Ubiquitin carboxyl-terminal hydrolase n=1 Tax=Vannella robusta TaxID=1487602 RepID=A0A7S4HGN8_9EUKA
MPFTVNVKWGKDIFKDVTIDTEGTVEDFKAQLFSLSGVAPERQKIMVPRSGQLKDGTSWDKYKLKDKMTIMLMGSKAEIKAPEKETVFVEDLPDATPFMIDHQPGLMNTGNTCYLNSTIQALSVVPPLQKSLIRYAKENGNDRVANHLGNLLNILEQKNEPFLPLGMFITTMRQVYPQFDERGPNGVHMQQDAEECFSLLLQSMKNVPGLRGSGDIISDLFEGEYAVTSSCVECPEEKEVTIEPFSKIPVHIDAETSFLQSGIKNRMSEHITKTSSILGREAIYEKSSKISKLPFYLPVQFVRFFWRQDKNLRAKICKPVEFPQRLDMFEFCTEELQNKLAPNREAISKAEEKALNIKKGHEKKSEEPETEALANTDETMEDVDAGAALDNDTGFYELLAVVSHQGRSAEGGHYVAWVKRDAETWLLYDDDKVSVIPADDIKKLTGHGGADWHIAYLCIYGSLRKQELMPDL